MDDERSVAAAADVRWSDLPPELWEMIGRRLDSYTDILRFRSVCSRWRSLVPRLPRLHPPLSVPCPVHHMVGFSAKIIPATIFRLEPSIETSPSDGPPTSRQGWLIKVSESNPDSVVKSIYMVGEWDLEPEPEPEQESNSGKIWLLSPPSHHRILPDRRPFPEHLDLLKFRATELCKDYILWGVGEVEKVLISPTSPWRDPKDTVAIAITKDGNLCYWKQGQESWSNITDDRGEASRYDDIILYKGQFYVVDNLGTVSWIDSSIRVVQFSPPMCGGGNRKHLVESGGDIIVIDRYNLQTTYPDNYRGPRSDEAVNFKVYRLDQKWGKWEEVRNLGDVVFFLGTSCSFSVSVQDIDGCPGNCIYFVEGEMKGVYLFSLGSWNIRRTAFLDPLC
ncbi:F-box protein At2g26160-like [Punica granatum]|uniref:F-box protein At2g26160-like n=1 Tax=Punica granatum TaxID=22663 RepID=A0A6P8D387_PUNGR|nr:F-box protein At2g26160-like [Punica granatum]